MNNEKIEILKKLIESDVQNADLYFLLGSEYKESGNVAEAAVAFAEALKLGGEDIKDRVSRQMLEMFNLGAEGKSPVEPDAGYVDPEEDEPEDNESDDDDPEDGAEYGDGSNVILLDKAVITLRKSEKPPGVPEVTFKDVGGLENLKNTISMKIIKPFEQRSLFNRFNKKIGGGIFLYGPPGCGKTFIARATAGECNARFINVAITDVLNKYIGESERNVKDIFDTARAQKPCVLFFDEIDTLGFNRSKLSSDYMRGVIDQLLTEIQGVDTGTDRMLIIGATNMPWDVDAAFKRPGRLDKAIFVPPPDREARKTIFQLKLAGRPCDKLDFDALAAATELFSGADIENAVEDAAESVIEDIMNTGSDRSITTKDILNVIKTSAPSTLDWLKTIKNYIKYANDTGFYNEVAAYIAGNKRI